MKHPIIKTVLAAVLILSQTSAALADRRSNNTPERPLCDLQVLPQVTERHNEVVVHSIRGNRDNLHNVGARFSNVLGSIILAPLFPATFAYFTKPALPEGVRHRHHHIDRDRIGVRDRMERSETSGRNSDNWYTAQTQEVILECHQYIRENFADDILADNGLIVVARHYRCGETYIYNSRHRNRVSVNVLYSDPVYQEMTLEEIGQRKCQKLNQCIAAASDSSELQQLESLQVQLGCQ